MTKILLCYYGVIPRSIRYTYKSIEENIINILKNKYELDIYVFNFDIEDSLIDGFKIDNNDIKYINNYYIFETEKQSEFDKVIDENYKNIINQLFYYKTYYNREYDSINAFRQLYTEYKVGCFIENNKDNYDIVIAICSDNYLCNPILLDNIEDCINNDNIIYISPMNDAGGYTNSFYFGNKNKMITLLKRYEFLIKNNLFLHRDYEFYVKFIMDINNIERGYANTYYFKIKNNKSIFWNRENYNYNFYRTLENDKLITIEQLHKIYNELIELVK
jgi:hypothetical protein